MKKILFVFLVIGVSSLIAAPFTSLFSDHKSFSIGDILTVYIAESSKASSSSQTNTGKSAAHNMSISKGQGPLSIIPNAGMGGDMSSNYRGDANTSRDASLNSRMTVMIIDIDDNGNLIIEGTRIVNINGEDEVTTITGLVRSQDVSADNAVQSYNIADAKISYKGKGVVNEGSRPGILSRMWNFIF